MMIYRAEQKTPPGFFRERRTRHEMKIDQTAKTVLVMMASVVLAFSAARATTITPNFTSAAGSGTQFNVPLMPTLSGGNTLPVTNFPAPPVSGGSLGPVSGGPGQVTTQPIPTGGPVVDAPRVPDAGSTIL